MKLSEYIHKKLEKSKLTVDKSIVNCPTEERIEKWIVEWYESEFNWQGKKKRPPTWLADWKRIPERSIVEQERCGIDEG